MMQVQIGRSNRPEGYKQSGEVTEELNGESSRMPERTTRTDYGI